MHRDIKPENILFRTDKIFDPNQIVISDFGLATHNDVEEYLFPRCGTPGFVAPEIYHHSAPKEHYSLKSDMYGVGVTLFFMIQGKLPYAGNEHITEENKNFRFDSYKISLLNYESMRFYFYLKLIFEILSQKIHSEIIMHRKQSF